MTDMELEQVTANLRTKSVADIGGLASDAFVGHGMRNDGDSMVVLHAIVVQLLGELAPLRKLREAAQYVQETWQLDSDREVAEVPFGPACMLRDRLAAWGRWQRLYVGQDIGGRG